MPAIGRVVTATALCVALVLTWSSVAGADPAEPTNYRSRVVRVVPETPAVDLEVVGGDGFLQLTVERGHEVIVPGTSENGPPYLRVLGDGTVQENQLSVNTYLNASRDGVASVPGDAQAATAATAPRWETVARDGRWAWHDHRIHWMGARTPPSVEGRAGPVDMGGPGGRWSVDLVVDGSPVAVEGTLVLEPAAEPWPWAAAGVATGLAAVAVGRRRPAAVAVACGVVAGVIALGVGVKQQAAVPAGAGGAPLAVVLPAVALIAVVAATALRRPGTWVVGVLAATATLGIWALSRLPVLWHAVLPTTLEFDLDRLGTAVTLGLVTAAGALAVWSGGGSRRSRTSSVPSA